MLCPAGLDYHLLVTEIYFGGRVGPIVLLVVAVQSTRKKETVLGGSSCSGLATSRLLTSQGLAFNWSASRVICRIDCSPAGYNRGLWFTDLFPYSPPLKMTSRCNEGPLRATKRTHSSPCIICLSTPEKSMAASMFGYSRLICPEK